MIIGLAVGVSLAVLAAAGLVSMAMYVAATDDALAHLRECECCQ